MNPILWTPCENLLRHSHLAQFIKKLNSTNQHHFSTYQALHDWSLKEPGAFWQAAWDYFNIKTSQPAHTTFLPGQNLLNGQWFLGAQFNFAENCLRHRSNHIAIEYQNEDGETLTLTYKTLFLQVAQLADVLKDKGVKANDRVAGILNNGPEAIIAMLATTSLGAIWSSCSPDFGTHAIIDRFEPIQPIVLFASCDHRFNGKIFHHTPDIINLSKQLPSVQNTILVRSSKSNDISKVINQHTHDYTALIAQSSATDIDFIQRPFNHPLYLLFSSGTTGKPKCFVHGSGGTLLQHLKELQLHTNLDMKDKLCFYTTCGWMMWNWMVSALALGTTLVLYDGNPFYPTQDALFHLIDKHQITVMGLGATLIEKMEKNQLSPKDTHSLQSLHTLLTTGSPLLPESFDYIHKAIKPSLQISSMSGGSDLISCFALGNPLLPVRRGELQCIGLGMAVAVADENGQPVINQKGELMCTQAFPSMPLYFWNDDNNEKYKAAYFTIIEDTWVHGDYALLTEEGGLIIYGRSDTTLNPGGIRIGSAEIYRHLESINEISDCLAVGQMHKKTERIILFVVLKDGVKQNASLDEHIRKTLKEQASPHHVPAKIIVVNDVPRTINGKLSEAAVKKIINGQVVNNTDALINPESLEAFYLLKDL